MTHKRIEKKIKVKVDDWATSITDFQLRKDVESKIIVTGGCIVSMLLKEEVKDYDIYFTDKEITRRIAEYYVNKFTESNTRHKGIKVVDEKNRIKIFIESSGVAAEDENILETPFEDVYDIIKNDEENKSKPKFRPIFLSQNAITLSDRIQLVIRFYGNADEIHKNYDFIHCTNYWTSEDNKLILRPEATQAILTKELCYVGSKYPLCSIIRTRKFIKRGWIINAGQYLKMMFQLSQLDLTDIAVLEDQLTGVDSAYFSMLIRGLKTRIEKESTFKINYPYIAKIIDRIF